MPYIVEKDYVRGTYLTVNAEAGDGLLTELPDPLPDPGVHPNVIWVADLLDESGLITLLQASPPDAVIYDDTEGFDTATGDRGNTESITIAGTGTAYGRNYIHLNAALGNSYTGQLSGNLYQTDLAIGDRVEFDIRILSRWCKIAQIKIVQQTMGAMNISFEVWEEIPIYEGNRLEMHKNVIRRNIVLTDEQGGWYGESLVNNLILYKDREEPGDDDRSDFQWNLHCALVNEDGGTASDFHVLFKIADIAEVI